MPQTKTQGAVFGLLMSYFMALGMEVANIAHKLGAMSNAVFLPALKETAFMGAIVFVVSTLYGSRAGQHIAHKFVRPGHDNPLLVTRPLMLRTDLLPVFMSVKQPVPYVFFAWPGTMHAWPSRAAA